METLLGFVGLLFALWAIGILGSIANAMSPGPSPGPRRDTLRDVYDDIRRQEQVRALDRIAQGIERSNEINQRGW